MKTLNDVFERLNGIENQRKGQGNEQLDGQQLVDFEVIRNYKFYHPTYNAEEVIIRINKAKTSKF